jgi:hypothetical protein
MEEKTNIFSLITCSMEAKRIDLIKIYAGSNKNVLGKSKASQDRSKANIIRPFPKKIEEKTKFSPHAAGSKRKQTMFVSILARSKQKRIFPKLGRISKYDRSKANQDFPKIEGRTNLIWSF